MNRFLVPLIGFVVLVGLFWFTLNRMNQGEYNPRDVPTEFIGRAAPAINVPDLMNPGKTVSSSDYLGAPWPFNVWGTWCPECWREHDYLMELARGHGVRIIGLNWRDDATEAKSMLAGKGNPFESIGFDPDSSAAIEWGVYGAPETFLIDAEGVIREKHAGAVTPSIWEEKFRPYFEQPKAGS